MKNSLLLVCASVSLLLPAPAFAFPFGPLPALPSLPAGPPSGFPTPPIGLRSRSPAGVPHSPGHGAMPEMARAGGPQRVQEIPTAGNGRDLANRGGDGFPGTRGDANGSVLKNDFTSTPQGRSRSIGRYSDGRNNGTSNANGSYDRVTSSLEESEKGGNRSERSGDRRAYARDTGGNYGTAAMVEVSDDRGENVSGHEDESWSNAAAANGDGRGESAVVLVNGPDSRFRGDQSSTTSSYGTYEDRNNDSDDYRRSCYRN